VTVSEVSSVFWLSQHAMLGTGPELDEDSELHPSGAESPGLGGLADTWWHAARTTAVPRVKLCLK